MGNLSAGLLPILLAMVLTLSAFMPSVPALADSTEDPSIGEVTDPGILPDSGFYFLKSWGRNIQLMFSASNTARAELMLRYASEDALGLHPYDWTEQVRMG